LVKIGRRAKVLLPTVTAIALVILITAFILFPDLFTLPVSQKESKMDVADLTIEPSYDWHSSNIRLNVTNTYNSPITEIGSRLNGVNFGYIKLEVPPGQTQAVVLPIGLKVKNSTNYYTKLTFTFDDGQYEIYSASLSSKEYVSAFIITGEYLNATSNSTSYTETIQNTGTIPLVSAKFTIGNYESSLFMNQNLMPKTYTTLNATIPEIPQKGETYNVILEATFADDSTFSEQSTYLFS
jgi:hypothetical protein